jgi:hypothetical protein
MIVDRLVPAGAGLRVAVDDTLFGRRRRMVHQEWVWGAIYSAQPVTCA